MISFELLGAGGLFIMTPNRRRGLKRVAIVYFAIAAIVGLWGWYLYDTGSDGWLEASKGSHYPEMTYYGKLTSKGIDFIEFAFVMGIALPVLGGIVGGVGYWIYRGFKPKSGE